MQVNAPISVASLSDSEATTLNVTSSPAVTTTGDQSYGGAVTSRANTGSYGIDRLNWRSDRGEQEPDAHQRCFGDAGRDNQRRKCAP